LTKSGKLVAGVGGTSTFRAKALRWEVSADVGKLVVSFRRRAFARNGKVLLVQGFQNKPAAAGAPAGVMKFTAGYFVWYLKYQFCSPSSTLSFQTKLFFLNLVYTL
jgi:hypothetical protein